MLFVLSTSVGIVGHSYAGKLVSKLGFMFPTDSLCPYYTLYVSPLFQRIPANVGVCLKSCPSM